MTRSRIITLGAANAWQSLWAAIQSDASFGNPFFNDGSMYINDNYTQVTIQCATTTVAPQNAGGVIKVSLG